MINTTFGQMKILYEDSDIIVVDKPHGLHSVEDRNGEQTETVRSVLDNIYGKIYMVHRLDAGTGGIMVCAKNPLSHKILCAQFEQQTTIKHYTALVTGRFEHPITVMLPISSKPAHGKFKINFKSGKNAATSFMPVKQSVKLVEDDCSIVSVTPFTGRTHQIRVHLRALKHPLLKDWVYNKPDQDRRLTLFADRLTFTHPQTDKEIKIEAELSEFMKSFVPKGGF